MTILLHQLAAIPWYTWVTLALVLLFVLGCVWSLVHIVLHALWYVFTASWRMLLTTVTRLLGWQPSSGGSAHWATRWELARAGVWNESGLALGTWRNGRTIHEPLGSHVALIAPPRTWKSSGVIMPNLKRYTGSVIVTDPRNELYEHTSAARECFGPVWMFDPGSPTSCSLNVLDGVRWHSPYCYGDVDRVVHHVLGPTGHPLEDSFRANAMPLLRALIFDRYAVGQGHFPGISAWLTDPTRSQDDKLNALIEESSDERVQRGARRTLDMSPRLRQGVWHAATESVGIFEDPIIASHTTKSDVHLADLLHGVDPVSIYLCMGLHEQRRLGRYLGLFIETFVTLISAPHAPARHKVLMVLDEMANLGKLSELEAATSHLQGSGCQCLFVLQNVNQILDTYGPTTQLLSSVANHVFYAPVPTDTRTSELVSKSLGPSTIVTVSTTQSFGTSVQTESERARALLTPDEVTRLPATDAIIFLQGRPPIYASKLGQTPPPWYIHWCGSLARHPGVSLSAAACLMLALLLWPLTRLQMPSTTHASRATWLQRLQCAMEPLPSRECQEFAREQSRQQTAMYSRRITPDAATEGAVHAWKMRVRTAENSQTGKPWVRGTYPDEQSCQRDLGEWDSIIHGLEQQYRDFPHQGKLDVVREANRRQWTTTPRSGQGKRTQEYWCTQE